MNQSMSVFSLSTRLFRYFIVLLLPMFVLFGCGGGTGDGGGSSNDSGGGKAEDSGGGTVSVMDKMRAATVKILPSSAAGVAYPTTGGEAIKLEVSKAGTGFFIDDTHIITANHVISGKSSIKVKIKGKGLAEGMEEISAVLTGVAECADLAVLELSKETPPTRQVTSLTWGVPKAGMAISVPGFPWDAKGKDGYSVPNGTVIDEETSYATFWASVKKVISHNVDIAAGSSGGPLVEMASGSVVGVNYAGARIKYAISSSLAKSYAERLINKENILSIGIVGEVVYQGGTGLALKNWQDGSQIPYGIWVSSVRDGGQAQKIGIQAGDIIRSLGTESLFGDNSKDSKDRSMEHYCDILESNPPNNPDDPNDKGKVLSVEIERYDENSSNPLHRRTCTGQINGTPLVKEGTDTPCNSGNSAGNSGGNSGGSGGNSGGSSGGGSGGNSGGSSVRKVSVVDTGQTTSYTTTYGQDSDYTINPPSYTDNGNGTVTDNVTGLMWQQEDDNNTYNWYEASGTSDATDNPGGAVDVCGSLTLGSYSDWRLPDIQELTDILNLEVFDPAIDIVKFPNTNSSGYWSSTTFASTHAGDSSRAWYVNFLYSYVDTYSNGWTHYVRCVRGGQ